MSKVEGVNIFGQHWSVESAAAFTVRTCAACKSPIGVKFQATPENHRVEEIAFIQGDQTLARFKVSELKMALGETSKICYQCGTSALAPREAQYEAP